MKRILVIEDDARFQGVLQEMLGRAGYEVLVAPDGKVGVGLYRDKHPDLVITDVIMPEKDGAEVIFDLQKEFPGVKMIVMTGGGQGDAQTYLKSIMMYSDVKYAFEKPFSMDQLFLAIEETLG
ncbi:MAG: response regulator [Candidatus Omnitrophica bacterium]|nr:response regulator [Candidatus Omnitrophota bacterium]